MAYYLENSFSIRMLSVGTHHNNAPGQGTLIRQPATAQLLIDSLDRFTAGYPNSLAEAQSLSSSNWSLNLQQVVMNGYVTRLGVSQILFHWNLRTVVGGYSDAFSVSYDGGAAVQVALVTGWYNVETMAAMLQAQLNLAVVGAAFVVQWDALRGVFSVDAGAGHTVVFQPPADNRERRTQHMLGLLAAQPAAQIQRGVPPTMLPTRYVDICSTYLTKYQRLKDANTLQSNITSTCIARLFAIPLNSSEYIRAGTALADASSPGDAPFVITVDYTFPKQIAWNPEEGISNFDIQLFDEDGELIPYNPAAGIMCEYNMVLLASED